MGIQRIGYFGGGNTAGGNLGREFCGNSIGIHMGISRVGKFGGGNTFGNSFLSG
jgi:hypothetical protein